MKAVTIRLESLWRARRARELHDEAAAAIHRGGARVVPAARGARAGLHFYIAEAKLQMGDYREARRHASRALKFADGDAVLTFRVGRTLLHLDMEEGRYEAAWRAARRLRRGRGARAATSRGATSRGATPEDRIRLRGDEAQILSRMGRLDEAEQIFRELMAAYGGRRDQRAKNNRAVLGHLLANCLLEQGRYSESLRSAAEALDAFRRLKNAAGCARVEATRGAAFLLLDLLPEAGIAYGRSAEFAEAAGLKRDALVAGQARANALMREGHGDAAAELLEKIRPRVGVEDAELHAAIRMSLAEWRKDRKPAAALRTLLDGPPPVRFGSRARFRLLHAELTALSGDHREAGRILNEREFRSRAAFFPELRCDAERLRGFLAVNEGRTKSALGHFRRAIEALELLQAGVGSPEGRITVLRRRDEIFRLAARAALDAGRNEAALEFLDRERRLLLATARDGAGSGDARERKTLDRLRKLYVRVRTRLPGKRGVSLRLTRELQRVEKELTLHRLERIAPPTVDLPIAPDAVSNLPERIVQLSYFLDTEGISALVRSGDRIVAHGRPTRIADVERAVMELHDELSFAEMRPASALLADGIAVIERSARKLYRMLIGDLEMHGKTETIWNVIPHAHVHRVPFALLHNGREYWMERNATAIRVRNVTTPGLTPWSPESKTALLVVGDPHGLGHLETEVTSVAERMDEAGWRLKILRGASPGAIQAAIGDANLVHFAGHGILRRDSPMYSHLLSGTGEPLFVADILRSLSSRKRPLVVLSACETGSRHTSEGGNITTLAGALLSAGAAAVIAADRRVDDEATSHLMYYLYSALLDGFTPAEALAYAQRGLRKDPWTAHPLYWAPWRVIEY